MIRYAFTNRLGYVITVGLDTHALDEPATLVYEGEPAQITSVRRAVEASTGVRAVRLNSRTTARDLRHAVTFDHGLQPFQPRLVEGHEILRTNLDG